MCLSAQLDFGLSDSISSYYVISADEHYGCHYSFRYFDRTHFAVLKESNTVAVRHVDRAPESWGK